MSKKAWWMTIATVGLGVGSYFVAPACPPCAAAMQAAAQMFGQQPQQPTPAPQPPPVPAEQPK